MIEVVNIGNEEEGMVSVRYLADRPSVPESARQTPRLEDLYLWLFPQENIQGKEVQ